MPSIITRGSMSAYAFGFMGRARGFVGSTTNAGPTGTSAIAWPTGTAAGDIGIICCFDNDSTPTLSTGSWTQVNGVSIGYRFFLKILTVADLTATITYTNTFNTGQLIVVFSGYSGFNTLTNQGETGGGGDTKTWTGFSKGASAELLLFFPLVEGSASVLTLTAPSLSSMSSQITVIYSSNGRFTATYDLNPGEYVDGTAVSYSGYTTSWTQRTFTAFELTGG